VDAEAFLSTDIGKFILGRAELEEAEALRELAEVDPFNSAAVMTAQNKLQLARKVPGWIHDAIRNGRVALMQLEDEENRDD